MPLKDCQCLKQWEFVQAPVHFGTCRNPQHQSQWSTNFPVLLDAIADVELALPPPMVKFNFSLSRIWTSFIVPGSRKHNLCPMHMLKMNFLFTLSGEKALIEFLQEEIASEKENLAAHLPSQLDGFQIKFDGAEVELAKQSGDEK